MRKRECCFAGHLRTRPVYLDKRIRCGLAKCGPRWANEASQADFITSDNLHLSRPKMADIQLVAALPELSKPTADEAVARLVRDSLAENSRRAYLSDLAHFESWGGQLPATETGKGRPPPTLSWL